MESWEDYKLKSEIIIRIVMNHSKRTCLLAQKPPGMKQGVRQKFLLSVIVISNGKYL